MIENLEAPTHSGIEDFAEYKDAILNFQESVDEIKNTVNQIKYPPTNTFGNIDLHQTNRYMVPGIEKPLSPEAGTITYKNALIMPQQGKQYHADHIETYYTDRSKYFPTKNIERRIRSILNADRRRKDLPEIPKDQPVLQYAEDGTIRDIDGYIIVAANLETYRRGTLVMTSLGPGRIYDTGKLEPGHFDIYTNRPRLDEIRKNSKKT